MVAIKGLKAMQRAIAPKEQGSKVNWFTLKAGEKVELIFLQELDESSDRYSEKNDLAIMIAEHNSPNKGEFWKRVACTNDEEHGFECWACEKNSQEWKRKNEEDTDYKGGWGRKINLYVNVLVRRKEDGKTVEEVAVLQRNAGGWISQIIDMAADDGFISNRLFTLSRKGSGLGDTTYTLMHRKEDAGVDVESYELFDLEDLVREVPYSEQAAALGAKVTPRRFEPVEDDTNPEDEEDDWL